MIGKPVVCAPKQRKQSVFIDATQRGKLTAAGKESKNTGRLFLRNFGRRHSGPRTVTGSVLKSYKESKIAIDNSCFYRIPYLFESPLAETGFAYARIAFYHLL